MMETYSSPAEEITGSEDIIRLSDVRERLENIRPFFAEDKRDLSYSPDFASIKEAEDWIAGKPEDERHHFWVCVNGHEDDELVALRALLEDAGEWTDGFSEDSRYMVSEDHLTDWAESEGDSYGVGEDNPVHEYVDWEEFAKALIQDMSRIEYRGSTYYMRG